MADLIAELADCPFCGGEAMHREETTATKDCCHYVRCRPCGAETALQPTPEIAAYAWNRRNAEIAAAVRDARRWRYVVENSEWIRDEEDTLMAVRFEDAWPNLESVGMRTDAIDHAMRAGEGEG
jgi:Lar family restriction alleviation protein